MSVEDVHDRVRKERGELLANVSKLRSFIHANVAYRKLSAEHQYLLAIQLKAMETLELVLLRRESLLWEESQSNVIIAGDDEGNAYFVGLKPGGHPR